VDDRGANVVVFASGDPLCCEGVERGEDGATEPDGVLAGGLVIDMNGCVATRRLQVVDVVTETTGQAVEQCVTTREHDVGQHLALHVLVSAQNTLVDLLMEALLITLAAKGGLEEDFGAAEALVSDQNFAPIWHFVVHFTCVGLAGLLQSVLEVGHHVSHCLFDVLDNM